MDIKINKIPFNENPIDYVADEGLIRAVEIAMALGKPLLVTGEPGTGKTRLADYVAEKLFLQNKESNSVWVRKPFVFNTKSNSTASDLFYFYDAIGHFRSRRKDLKASHYIELKAMGLAIAQTHGSVSEVLRSIGVTKNFKKKVNSVPSSSVVLIDEIDKAPREFPNDLLNEMENYEFDIKEINQMVRHAENDTRIFVIMTSNSEKNLPHAFLRRCIFYYIDFPDKNKLMEITKKRLLINDDTFDSLIEKAIEKFNSFRNKALNKKPSTPEFMDWISVLKMYNLLKEETFAQDNSDSPSTPLGSVLIKSVEDNQRINNETE